MADQVHYGLFNSHREYTATGTGDASFRYVSKRIGAITTKKYGTFQFVRRDYYNGAFLGYLTVNIKRRVHSFATDKIYSTTSGIIKRAPKGSKYKGTSYNYYATIQNTGSQLGFRPPMNLYHAGKAEPELFRHNQILNNESILAVLDFKSYNKNIARINNAGTIWAVNKGTVLIEVKSTDGSNKVCRLKLTIKKGNKKAAPTNWECSHGLG